jgi:hypothetical protein
VRGPEFLTRDLTRDDVLSLHADQIRRNEGATGLRALLVSAIAMRETSCDEECGNKRTTLM